MNQSELKEIEAQLIDEKRELEGRIKDFMEQEDFLEGSVGELNSLDETHPGDQGTELFERQKDMTFYYRYRDQLVEVENALKKIEDGTYGVCEKTGQQIPDERLKAMPTARTVVEADD